MVIYCNDGIYDVLYFAARVGLFDERKDYFVILRYQQDRLDQNLASEFQQDRLDQNLAGDLHIK